MLTILAAEAAEAAPVGDTMAGVAYGALAVAVVVALVVSFAVTARGHH